VSTELVENSTPPCYPQQVSSCPDRGWNPRLGLIAAALLIGTQACGMTADDVERITPEALKAGIASKDAVAVDLRASVSWYTGHIMGAYWIYYYELEERALDELPPDKLIVTYCS